MSIHPPRVLAALLALAALPSLAQDVSLAGFGTLGYASSNRSYALERSITNSGTFRRDSVLGVQADVRFTPQWSATLQVKAAQSVGRDKAWEVRPAWAFVAWRPSDDWLLRAGKMRLPLYLHSEALDVGISHDMARLPSEMYSIAPANDFTGLYATKTWPRGDGEVSLDVYGGRAALTYRYWARDGLPPAVPAGAGFLNLDIQLAGAVLSLREAGAIWRVSALNAVTRRGDGSPWPVTYPFVNLGGGLGYYRVNPALPGPPIPTTDALFNLILTIGVEQPLGADWRVAAEFVRNVQRETELGGDSRGGYVALFRRIGEFTPYVSLGALRSGGVQLDNYRRLTGNPLPAVVPGAALINGAQNLTADSGYAIDQRSLALGSAWMLNSNQKLKLEWRRTRIGLVSRLVDAPSGAPAPHDTSIDVWSLNYNFSF